MGPYVEGGLGFRDFRRSFGKKKDTGNPKVPEKRIVNFDNFRTAVPRKQHALGAWSSHHRLPRFSQLVAPDFVCMRPQYSNVVLSGISESPKATTLGMQLGHRSGFKPATYLDYAPAALPAMPHPARNPKQMPFIT